MLHDLFVALFDCLTGVFYFPLERLHPLLV
jgi:hypothetical protein